MALTKLLIQTLNFKDLVDEIMEEFPCGYGDVVKLFYFCADSKSNIQIHLDQDLMHMFAKHMSSKCCCMSIAYHKPDADPPEIPLWDNVVPALGVGHEVRRPWAQTEEGLKPRYTNL